MDFEIALENLSLHDQSNSNSKSKKQYNIIGICADRINDDHKEYLVVWEDGHEQQWVSEYDVSNFAIKQYYEKISFINEVSHQDAPPAFIYVRTSNEKVFSANLYNSITVQLEEIKKFISGRFNIMDYFIDNGVSGKKLSSQPALNYLLKSCQEYPIVRHILIYDVSRFTRDLHSGITVIDSLKKNNVYINFIADHLSTEYPGNLLPIHVKLAEAEEFSRSISNKVRLFRSYCKDNNIHLGRAPYGFDKTEDKKLVKNLIEFRHLKDLEKFINSYKRYGCKSYIYKLALVFFKNNKLLNKGKQFTIHSVKTVINRHFILKKNGFKLI